MELFSVFVETILTLSCCLCRLHSHAPFFFHFGLCISDPRKACFCSLWNHWNRSTVNSIWNSNLHLLQNELSWYCTVALKFHKSKSRAQGQEVFDKTIWIDMKIMTFHSQIYCFMEKKKALAKILRYKPSGTHWMPACGRLSCQVLRVNTELLSKP